MEGVLMNCEWGLRIADYSGKPALRQSAFRIRRSAMRSAVHDFSPYTFVGENLKQETVGHAAVDQMDALHAFLQGTDRALHLGPHSLVHDSALLQTFNIAHLHGGD